MKGYGQFCPVAKAAEIVGERWTPLVLRELLCGSRRFNDLRRGVPTMSPTLLSKRLKTLEDVGIVIRQNVKGSNQYSLTAAGEELRPIIEALGVWGRHWVRHKISNDDLDAGLLMWDVQRCVQPQAFPEGRIVVRFEFKDAPRSKRLWWIVSDADDVDLCLTDPGFEPDLYLSSSVRTFTELWIGDISFSRATTREGLSVTGPSALRRRLRAWLGFSAFAPVPMGRKRPA